MFLNGPGIRPIQDWRPSRRRRMPGNTPDPWCQCAPQPVRVSARGVEKMPLTSERAHRVAAGPPGCAPGRSRSTSAPSESTPMPVRPGSSSRAGPGWQPTVGSAPWRPVARRVQRQLPNLLTYLRHRLTNAGLEAVNAVIQWVKKRPGGFTTRSTSRSPCTSTAEVWISTHAKAGRALRINPSLHRGPGPRHRTAAGTGTG